MRVAPEPDGDRYEVQGKLNMAGLANGCEGAREVGGSSSWNSGEANMMSGLADELTVLQRVLAVQYENAMTFVNHRIHAARSLDFELHELRSDNRTLRAQLSAAAHVAERRKQLLVEGQEAFFRRHEAELVRQCRGELGKEAVQMQVVRRARAVASASFQALPDVDKMVVFPAWKEVIAEAAMVFAAPSPVPDFLSNGGSQALVKGLEAPTGFCGVVPALAVETFEQEKKATQADMGKDCHSSRPSLGALNCELKDFRDELRKWRSDVGSSCLDPVLVFQPGECPLTPRLPTQEPAGHHSAPEPPKRRKESLLRRAISSHGLKEHRVSKDARTSKGSPDEEPRKATGDLKPIVTDKVKHAGLHGVLGGATTKPKERPSLTDERAKANRKSVSNLSKFKVRRNRQASKSGNFVQELIDMGVAVTILVNGIFMGLSANYMATTCSDQVPAAYSVLEMVFAAIFAVELAWRIAQNKSKFFQRIDGWQWNAFDSFLVALQLWDVTVELYLNSGGGGSVDAAELKNVSFLKLLRVLRTLRVLRLVRLLAFFGELNVVTSAIVGSFKQLIGAILMLFLLMYIVGIVFTQFATVHRIELKMAGEEDDEGLLEWWSSVGRGILSLYEAIHGGADWNDIVVPLFNISPFLGFGFVAYVAFVLLAMMNVITGIFVESALKNAERTKDTSFAAHVRGLYKMADADGSGLIGRDEFEACISDPNIVEYMKDLGIDSKDALLLFEFLDDEEDDSSGINAEELLKGLLRLRAGTKFTDIMHMFHEIDMQKETVDEKLDVLTSTTNRMNEILQRLTARRQPIPRGPVIEELGGASSASDSDAVVQVRVPKSQLLN